MPPASRAAPIALLKLKTRRRNSVSHETATELLWTGLARTAVLDVSPGEDRQSSR